MTIKTTLTILLLGLLPLYVSAQTIETKRADGSLDWPMARGNVASTGAFAESVGDEFEIEWEYKYPKGAFESSPIIVHHDGDTTVYVAGIDVNVQGKVIAIDLATGKSKWQFDIKEGFVASPAWHNGRIYVGDMAGMLYCIDENGMEVWQYEAQGEISSGANFFESTVLFGSQDATLYAIDMESGKLKWSHSVEDQIQCGATVAGDRCFLAGCDSKLHIVGLKDGKEFSFQEIGSPTGTTAAVLGEAVLFGTEQGTFLSIDYMLSLIHISEPTRPY